LQAEDVATPILAAKFSTLISRRSSGAKGMSNLTIGNLPAACDVPLPPKTKKPTWWSASRRSTTSAYFLTNLPAEAGLFFI